MMMAMSRTRLGTCGITPISVAYLLAQRPLWEWVLRVLLLGLSPRSARVDAARSPGSMGMGAQRNEHQELRAASRHAVEDGEGALTWQVAMNLILDLKIDDAALVACAAMAPRELAILDWTRALHSVCEMRESRAQLDVLVPCGHDQHVGPPGRKFPSAPREHSSSDIFANSCWHQAMQVLQEVTDGERRAQVAVAFLERLQTKRVPLMPLTLQAAVGVCARGTQWVNAMSLFHRFGVEADVLMYDAAISASSQTREWRVTVELIAQMRFNGLRPHAIACGEGILAYAGVQHWHHALLLLHRTVDCKIRPNLQGVANILKESSCLGTPISRQRASWTRPIPKVIHKVILVDGMGMPTLSESMGNAVRSFEQLNSHYQLRIYSGTDCSAYIRQHFDNEVLHAFEALRPYAYKCDLFRYLVLLREGGFYSDMRQVCLQPLDQVFPPDMTWFSAIDDPPYMHNAFLASVPGHPWLKRAVKVVLQNIRGHHYGDCPLDPSGPGALGRACDLEELGPTCLIGEHHIEGGDGYILNHLGDKFIMTKYRKHNGEKYLPGEWGIEDGGGQNYNDLWLARRVYK